MPTILSTLLRWSARLSAVFVAGVFALIVIGEFAAPHSGPPTNVREVTGIVLLFLTVGGMVLAWRHEFAGAVLSLLSLTAFVAMFNLRDYTVLGVAAIPGLLYLLDWLSRRWTGAHGHPHQPLTRS